MNAQRGFTLIELVVVIIVLGILAVTAAPKFIDLQGDARAATINGLKGALQSANSLVYSMSAVKGVQDKNCKTDSSCVAVPVGSTADVEPIFGNVEGTFANLQEVADLDANDWSVNQFDSSDTGSPATGTLYITPKGVLAKFSKTSAGGSACQLIYKQASSKTAPATVTAIVGDCE